MGILARVRRGLIALLCLLAIAPAVSAQSIVDARRVEFTPSPDNNAVDPPSGQALVTNYRLDVYQAGGAGSLAVDDRYLYAAIRSDVLRLPR